MIPFFRKIRKKLADENKPLKYARYAIGEIVLVMVGILLALQVNNWNQTRIDRKLELQFLSRFKSDLITDITYYDNGLKQSISSMESNTKFIMDIHEKQTSMAEVEALFSKISLSARQLITRNSTYLELINSGKLNLISDVNLKSALINYYRNNQAASEHFDEFNRFAGNTLVSTVDKVPNIGRLFNVNDNDNGRLPPIKLRMKFEGEYEYINDPSSPKFQQVANLAAVYAGKTRVFSDYFKELGKEAADLIIYIDIILDKK